MSKFLDLDGLRYFFTKIRTQFDGRYYKQEQVDTLLNGKSDTSHTHDERYYTETEMDGFLGDKADINSPTFTGTPKAPTASQGDGSTQLATTAYVDTGLSGKASSSHNHDTLYYTKTDINSRLDAYVTKTGVATQSANGAMSASDKTNLDNTAITNISLSEFTVSTDQVEIYRGNSRAYMFNRMSNYAMVALYLTIDIEQNQADGTAIVRDLPQAVGVPVFAMAIKNATNVVPAYINGNGNLVIAGALTAGQRVYANVVYYTKNAGNYLN